MCGSTWESWKQVNRQKNQSFRIYASLHISFSSFTTYNNPQSYSVMLWPCKQIDISKHTFIMLLGASEEHGVRGRALLSRNIMSKFVSRSMRLPWGFHRLPRKQFSCCLCYSNICIAFSSIFRSPLFISQFTEFRMHSVGSKCWIYVCWSELNDLWRHIERGSWTWAEPTFYLPHSYPFSQRTGIPHSITRIELCIDQLNFLCFCQERQICVSR